MKKVLGILVVALAFVGCGGGGGGGGGEGGGGETAGGESMYAGAIASTDVAHGQQRYEAVCGSCHNNGAPALANIAWTAEHMRRQIREGEDQMPAIRESRLSNDDMEAVLAYLESIGAIGGAEAGAPAEEQPAEEQPATK